MTKQQATSIDYHTILHFGLCARSVGPRGGVTTDVVEVRVSGTCQTWKRDTQRFRLPIKHGLYTNGAVTESNGELFHLASECPLVECAEVGCHQVLRASDASKWQHTHKLPSGYSVIC